MQVKSRKYECTKPTVLAAIYDSLEELKWKLLSANSDAGIVFASEPASGIPFLLRVLRVEAGKTEIILELASGVYSESGLPEEKAEYLLQVITKLIKNAFYGENFYNQAKE